jgi:ankyrin repeat protein
MACKSGFFPNKVIETDQARFLLARLYVDALLDKRTKSKVQSTLETLSNGSQTLEKAYDDAIKRLESQLPEDTALATRVISWIVYAERAFTITELRHALAVELVETSFDPDNIVDIEDIISVCAGLVTVDKTSNIIRLVHYTAQEYFERVRHTWRPHGQLDITSTCLTYLSFDVFRSGSCSDGAQYSSRLRAYPFFEYAAQYWGRHAFSVQEEVFDMVCAALFDKGLSSSMSQILHVTGRRHSNYRQINPQTRDILHVLSYFGLHVIAEKLLAQYQSSADYWVAQKDDVHKTCLYVAVEQNHDAMVRLLLDRGAKVNEEVGSFGTVLKVAVSGGSSSMVKLLLDNGADVNMNNWRGITAGTALHLASEGDNIVMARLLLEHGADATIKNTHGQTSLQLAAERRSYQVVKLLLDWMPEGSLGTADEPKYTPLLWACASGQLEAVRLFLSEGADANSCVGQGWTPLHAASNRGHLQVVQMLLDNGADPNLRNHKGQTPLQCALSKGYFLVVELLLSRKVHLDYRGKLAHSIMDKALSNGRLATVKMLLERGAEVNMANNYGRTPINNAARNGQLEAVQLLLKHGADLRIADGGGFTPLHQALRYSCQLDLVKLLQEKGDVSSTSGGDTDIHSRTLLHFSARNGHLDIFLYIADQDIDPLAKDAKGDDLLSYAASSASLPVFQKALSMSPVLPVRNGHWSALHWACRGSNAAIVEELIQSGLNGHCVMLSQSEDIWSPADIAIYHGHKKMLERLSESCKAALGPLTKPERSLGKFRNGVNCDGCFNVSHSWELIFFD